MSTIQRQYSLPNCVLILEGLDDLENTSSDLARQSLSILTRCECHFANQPQSLIGGRDFFEALMKATHTCAQTWMSGIASKSASRKNKGDPTVQLHPQAGGQFCLQVPTQLLHEHTMTVGANTAAKDSDTSSDDPGWVTLNLSTVQLFDLMEAVDQVLTDTQTLPDLALKVHPLARREAHSGSGVGSKSASLALGTVTLAVAAAAFFWLPVPEVRRPPEDEPLPPPTTESAPEAPAGSPPASNAGNGN
ncbi:DUF4335 domain-containing protein [Synechococcales cyanobacterium C]|uniref:DUF4335 domain-containing protein n=1 Tax=Petrachloros mirabilis ULC683 TaxID=2781853 RepID=A0A8K2A7T0_9CYAN|nr:DUF4335 domain-containing protein [Petrachloros mirabilis]NCJ06519.1 DUF4335 domain-containing protein [Petrachloros mirabilis ULC683]